MPDLKMLNSTKYLYKLTLIKCSYEPLSAVTHPNPLCSEMLTEARRLSFTSNAKAEVIVLPLPFGREGFIRKVPFCLVFCAICNNFAHYGSLSAGEM